MDSRQRLNHLVCFVSYSSKFISLIILKKIYLLNDNILTKIVLIVKY
ncbi:hypothetical protein ACVW2L_001984 [Mucilaginibacter sp. HD30]